MAATNMTCLIPKAVIQPLRLLGKYDWMEFSPTKNEATAISVTVPNDPQAARLLPLVLQNGPKPWLFSMSKALATGPKLLLPSVEQCLVLENVDLTVKPSEYQQPFPVVIVELPTLYRNSLATRFKVSCPRFAVVHHHVSSGHIFVYDVHGANLPGVTAIINPHEGYASVEEALSDPRRAAGNDIEQATLIHRVALNFSLMLTVYGAKDLGPLDPVAVKRAKTAKRKKGRQAANGRVQLAASMNRIGFAQDVRFCERSPSPSSEVDRRADRPEKTTPKSPHWRRGFFRRQRIGPGRTETKIVFIRPILINANRFAGDAADTTYQIRG